MLASFVFRAGAILPLLLWLYPCWPLAGGDPFPEETAFRAVFASAPINLKGRVVDASGCPLVGCDLRLDSGASALTTADGTFEMRGLTRSNQVLTAAMAGYYRQLLPVQLFVSLSQTNLVLPPLVLWPENTSVVRFVFGGDTAFGRHFLDPEERAARNQMPIENPSALISVANPLPGTLAALSYIKPLFLLADYPVLNFESVVTSDPSTPHWEKEFAYFSLPGSVPALKSLNIDYVGLGNNHVYDYLESGVSATRRYFDEIGIHYSGLGSNSTEAFAPYRTLIKGASCSFVAMTSVGGEQHDISYVADANKGGAAYIRSKDQARQAISAEKTAGRVTILQAHVGDEYTLEPTATALNWMKFGVDAGADLVVSHHSHIAQGFGMYKGTLLLHSLGNLCFDQDRLETMVGMVATVDMEGHKLRRAWGTPIYLEDYRPRLLSGGVTSILLRRIGEVSQQLRVFPYNGQAWVATPSAQYSFRDRRIEVPVVIDTNGWTIIDLREFATLGESLLRIEADAPGLTVRPGRDLLAFGGFEDVDVDDEWSEASRWSFSTNTVVALRNPYRGTAALCLQRSRSVSTDAVASLRNRVRVVGDSQNTPNKDLSVFGYVRGQSAGRVSVVCRYYASEGTNEFGEELASDQAGGTFDWRPFMQDLHLPPDDPNLPGDPPAINARATRIFLHHSPPATGSGYAWFDELAIVSWEERLAPLTAPVLATPHARDFLRMEGPSGTYRLALTFRSYRPGEVDSGHGPDLGLETEQPDQSVDRLWFHPTAIGFEDCLRLVIRNLGDQPLVVSNLTFVSGHVSDFAARWLGDSGSTEKDTLALPPHGAGRLEVRFIPRVTGKREAVLQFQSNDPDDGQSPASLSVEGNAYADVPVRFISENRTASPVIHVQVPATAAAVNLLLEQLPEGVSPVNISQGGRWEPVSRTLQWESVAGRSTVSYSLTGASNLCSLSGWLVWSGQSDETAGDSLVLLFAPADSDGDGLPDWWEQKFFDSRMGALPDVDSDGDGQTNLAEYLAGTHPLDHGFWAVQWAPYLRNWAADEQLASFEVVGSEGVSYRVEESTNLQSWCPLATGVLSGQRVVLPRTNSPPPRSCFYRAVLDNH